MSDAYDAGLLNNWGGGNVEWWQDYIRAELERSHEFYAAGLTRLRAQVAAADKLAEAVREITGGLIASGLWLDLQIGKDFLDALSAYEGGKE